MGMDKKKQIDLSKILKIFEKMSYGENNYETKNGVEWLKNKANFYAHIEKHNEGPNGIPVELESTLTAEKLCTVNISEIDTIKQILLNTKKDVKWIERAALMRSKILYSLGQEIEKKSDLFAEIELIVRGITPRDTKTDIPLLAQYFYYYSIFTVKYRQENRNWEPPGISFGTVSAENALSNLGLYLAPALAAGYNIVLQVGTKIAPSAFLLLDLAKKVGVGEDTIRVIPSDDEELLPYFNSENVAIISLFANIYNGKYRGVNHTNKKILALCPFSLPVLIFDNADLDSACESIILQFWESTRSLTGCENYVFVQENVLSTFLNKFKTTLRKVKIGRADEKEIDIAYPINKPLNKYNDLLTKAKAQGYDIYKKSCDRWSPILLIGNKTVLKLDRDDEDLKASIAFVIPFRSTGEAIALVNNLQYGLGISIWSENIRVIKDVMKKIETTNIWINKNPKFAANVTFSPMKKSGFGYFGGKEGFYEYVEIGKINPVPQSISISASLKISNTLIKVIEVAKKAQPAWRNIEKLKQINIFQKMVEYLEENKSKLSDSKEKQYYEDWIDSILECIGEVYNPGPSNTFKLNQNVLNLYVPKGVLVIESRNSLTEHNIKLIMSAIYEGNAVILVTNSEGKSVCAALSKLCPTGVLNVCSEVDAMSTISGRQDVKIFIGNEEANPVFTHLPAPDNSNEVMNYSSGNIYRKITFAKNVWN